jgi:hypothetical protein
MNAMNATNAINATKLANLGTPRGFLELERLREWQSFFQFQTARRSRSGSEGRKAAWACSNASW